VGSQSVPPVCWYSWLLISSSAPFGATRIWAASRVVSRVFIGESKVCAALCSHGPVPPSTGIARSSRRAQG
jgi:hypothetical protein